MPNTPEFRLTANRLLAALPSRDRAHLVAGCENVELAIADVLVQRGARLRHVHFPTAGIISIVASVERTTGFEIGLVGDEGMLGTSLVLGVSASRSQALVQGTGRSLRMEAAQFRRELRRSAALQGVLHRYLYVRMLQLAQAAGCAKFHRVEARLARWLLMTQDRAHSSRFQITHEALALMLGVRRAGVTNAASALQRQGLIRYRRGDIAILDRPGLRRAACACYRRDRESYAQMLG